MNFVKRERVSELHFGCKRETDRERCVKEREERERYKKERDRQIGS
jgi:hypothetical protein